MPGYLNDSLVTVYPFTHRTERDAVVIGDLDRDTFVAIPAEGLGILESLAAGRTVGEALAEHERRFGEPVDIPDFLAAMEKHGFVAPAGHDAADGRGMTAHQRGWSVRWLTPALCRKIISTPALAVLGLMITVGAALLAGDSRIMPTPASLMFPIDFAWLTWGTGLIAAAGVFLHELGHVAAARACGLPTRVRLSNRMYLLVAETDMTGIWLTPKRYRYRAFMMGAVIDAASASLVIAFLWAARHGWIHPVRWLTLLATSVLLMYIIRLLWQLFFFLRTDGYYVLATAFNCRDLMSDTENLLRNLTNRALRRGDRLIDQSGVPRRERRVVRAYACLWVLGRIIALTILITGVIPVLWAYLYQFILLISGQHSKFTAIDFITITIYFYLINFSGLILWIRSLYKGAARRRAARATAAES